MTSDNKIELLEQANESIRTVAENKLVEAMFDGLLKSTKTITSLSDWVLVGTTAMLAFLVANSANATSAIGKHGFVYMGSALCLAGLVGVVAKLLGGFHELGLTAREAGKIAMVEAINGLKVESIPLREAAERLGVKIDTGLRVEKVIAMFISPAPRWAKYLLKRRLSKDVGDPHQAQLPLIAGMNRLHMAIALQVLSFAAAVLIGFGFAVANV